MKLITIILCVFLLFKINNKLQRTDTQIVRIHLYKDVLYANFDKNCITFKNNPEIYFFNSKKAVVNFIEEYTANKITKYESHRIIKTKQ